MGLEDDLNAGANDINDAGAERRRADDEIRAQRRREVASDARELNEAARKVAAAAALKDGLGRLATTKPGLFGPKTIVKEHRSFRIGFDHSTGLRSVTIDADRGLVLDVGMGEKFPREQEPELFFAAHSGGLKLVRGMLSGWMATNGVRI